MAFDWRLYILKLSLYCIPLYLANSIPVLSKGKTPIDFGKKFFDGKPLFGKGKTFKGAFAGILFALISGIMIQFALPKTAVLLNENFVLLALLLGVGAIIGDMIGSFIKRRFGIERGKSVLILDQLDFVVGGIAFGAILYIPTVEEIIGLVIVTLIAHKIGNEIAFRAKWKKTRW